jgi:hypothetical protein
MSSEEEQDEMIFSEVLLNQKEKVEQECVKLQALIDLEVPTTSFMWLPDSNHVNIVDDIFRKSKIIREHEPEDVVPHNSHMPNQIHIQQIGGKKNIIPLENNVPDNVILEVEGSANPPTFVPYNYVHHRIEMYKTANDVLNNDVSDNDVWRSKTPEHVPGESQSPKTPWSQKREHHVLVPQNSGDSLKVPLNKVLGIQLLGLYKPSGEGLFFLIIIYYILIFSYIQR